jgi:hypothetical protein
VGAGRPTKFDQTVRTRLLQAVEHGHTLTTACQVAGVSMDSLARWRAKFADFADELREAEGRSVDRWLSCIEAAAPKNWLAAAWLLERRHPHEYGRHLVFDRSVTHDEATLRQLAIERGLDPDQFVAAVARVQAASQAAKQAGAPGQRPIALHPRGTRF